MNEVIAELKKIQSKASLIRFVDEYWGLNSADAIKFCELYKKHVKKSFVTYLNYEYMLEHRDVFDKFIDAGFCGTGVGFQSGSEQFARDVYNRNHKNKDLIDYTNLCFRKGLAVTIHMIGGNCYETEDVFLDTVKLLQQLPSPIEEPYRIPLLNFRLRPHPETPIRKIFPNVVQHPSSSKEWFYRAILWEIARLTTYDEFLPIYDDKAYKEDVKGLYAFFIVLKKKKQLQHFIKIRDELSAKNVVFYGCGSIYNTNKKFFANLKPYAMLVDKQYYDNDSIDGIRCLTPETFFDEERGEEFTYVTFIQQSHFPRIYLQHKKKIDYRNVYSITMNLDFDSFYV